jgi:hypothetical protein
MGTQYMFLYPKLFTAPSRAEPPPFLQSPRSAGAPSSLPFLLAISTQAAAAALRLGLCDCVSGFPSGLRPPAVTARPRPRSSAHQPVTLRACLSLSSRLRWIVNGAWPRRQRDARLEGNGSQQPLLHQGGSKALPFLLALQRADACA